MNKMLRTILVLICFFPVANAFADTRLIANLDMLDAWSGNYNASHWIEQGNIQPGAKMYGERSDITITQLPAFLRGADWIQTASSSALTRRDTLATFLLKGDAEVFIAYTKGTSLPGWLSAYTATKLSMSNSAGANFGFFSKKFHAGDTVCLGNNGNADSTMYMIVVKATGKLPALQRPEGKVFDILKYGAKGDDQTVNTKAIQSAIDDCAKAGGGSVYIHDGIFVTGSLELKDNVTLFVEAGSILRGSSDHDDYTPMISSLASYRVNEGRQLIYADSKRNIGITGGGIIDGFSHGTAGPWNMGNDQGLTVRPRMVRMMQCRNINIRNITLIRSAYWTQYYEGCDTLVIDNQRIRCYTGQHNQDGIDISGCKKVELKNYYAITGDDAVCLKSMSLHTSDDIYIHDIFIRYANCHAVKIGTETHADIRNVKVNRVVANARYGTAIESVDGAMVENIVYDGILLTGCSVPIFIRLGNRGRVFEGGPHPAPAGGMRNITVRNLVNTGIGFVEARDGPGVGSSITGVPGLAIENLLIENCRFLYYGSRMDTSLVNREIPENVKNYPEFNILGVGPAYGLFTRHVKNVTYRNIDIRCLHEDVRPAIVLDDVKGYTLSKIRCDSFPGTRPHLILSRQDGALSTESTSSPHAQWPEGFHVDSVPSSMDKAWQKMYVYQSTAATPQPLVISLHTWSGNYTQQDSLADVSKANNWNYIHPDFRGENKRPEAGGSDLALNDIDDAIEWAIRHFKVDTDRMYVAGVSGGGYATLCAYGRLKHKITSFTAWVPLSDMNAWYYESLFLTPKYAKDILGVTGSTPDHLNEEEMIKRSPLYAPVPKERLNRVPVTVLAGIHDGHGKNAIPITHSLLYYNKLLRDKGVKDSTAYISENDMRIMLTQQRFPVKDSTYIGGRLIWYEKKYENIRLVIFEGGHEMLYSTPVIF